MGGDNHYGQCDVYRLPAGLTYVTGEPKGDIVVTLNTKPRTTCGHAIISCTSLSGNELDCFSPVQEDISLGDIRSRIAVKLGVPWYRLQLLLGSALLLPPNADEMTLHALMHETVHTPENASGSTSPDAND